MAHLGYTRISTANQDDRLQRDALLVAGVQPDHIYSDVTSGASAAKTRPGMMKLLSFARSGDTVAVWRIDRLGRSLLDVLATVHDMQAKGLMVRSISDGIDPATTSGRLMLNLLSTLAEYERDLIVERVNAGIAAARGTGTIFGRPPNNPRVTAEKLKIAANARVEGKTAQQAAELVGWSRATLYRAMQATGQTVLTEP